MREHEESEKVHTSRVIERDFGVDLARAVYIGMMVLYHCFTNAQHATSQVQPDINVYLGLVSGSYPFLAGFMVSFYYLGAVRRGQEARLMERGLKLLAIYTLTNLLVLVAFASWIPAGVFTPGDNVWRSILTARPTEVVYDILVPLGQILVIGAAVLWVWARGFVRAEWQLQLVVLGVTALLAGLGAHLYLLCGLAGLLLGFRVTDRMITEQFRRPFGLPLGIAFLVAVFAFNQGTRQGLLYLPAVVVLFYLLRARGGSWMAGLSPAKSHVVQMTSAYSLPIYLAHVPLLIVVTQVLDPYVEAGQTWQVFCAYALIAAVTMWYMVRAVHAARQRVRWIDALYRFVMP